MKTWLCVWVAAVTVSAPALLSAADLGRQTITPADHKTGYTPRWMERQGDEDIAAGLEVALGVNFADWDIGAASFDDTVIAPQVSLFYVLSPSIDIRAVLKYSAPDDGNETLSGELTLWRLGVGGRYWFETGTDVHPYAGLLLNYYDVDADALTNTKGTLGFSGEAGVAFTLNDAFMMSLSVQYESFLSDPDGELDGVGQDISFSAASVVVGGTFLF